MARKKIQRHKTHKHPRKNLNDDQEFKLMTMVLDKFLWLGTLLIGIGIYFMLTSSIIFDGVPYIAAGLGIMLVFGITIVRYFENYSS